MITPNDVVVLSAWTEGHLTGKRHRARKCKIIGGTGGGRNDPIPASAFRLQKVVASSPLLYGSIQNIAVSCPLEDGSGIYLALVNPSTQMLEPANYSFDEADYGVITVTGV